MRWASGSGVAATGEPLPPRPSGRGLSDVGGAGRVWPRDRSYAGLLVHHGVIRSTRSVMRPSMPSAINCSATGTSLTV